MDLETLKEFDRLEMLISDELGKVKDSYSYCPFVVDLDNECFHLMEMCNYTGETYTITVPFSEVLEQ